MIGSNQSSTMPISSVAERLSVSTAEGPSPKPVPSTTTVDAPGDQESNLEDISPWDSDT